MTIGDKIKSFRSLKQMTQKVLAENAGVSEISIKKYEAGERNPKEEQLSKIANVLGVSSLAFLNIEINSVEDAGALILFVVEHLDVTLIHDCESNPSMNNIFIKVNNPALVDKLCEYMKQKDDPVLTNALCDYMKTKGDCFNHE